MTFTINGVMDRKVYDLVKKGLFRAMETLKKYCRNNWGWGWEHYIFC